MGYCVSMDAVGSSVHCKHKNMERTHARMSRYFQFSSGLFYLITDLANPRVRCAHIPTLPHVFSTHAEKWFCIDSGALMNASMGLRAVLCKARGAALDMRDGNA